MSHTVLLVQCSADVFSRTYSDFECVKECIDYVVSMFEEYLRRTNPHLQQVSYAANELFEFVDSLHDLSCMVLDKRQSVYVPYNKDWLKEKLLRKLQREELVV
ncbi:enhancer of rudimentary homolog [Bacillus rossius redtenbacheri]|uniref:enhancer of rudimentary homolog n=1 Tax=Bacillus rossius redtenbacheri TaxID=93214 RepID=UPI002FDD0F38